MKNLLLIAAFGLFASPAFAQNSASTTQSGTGNDADVIQNGSNSATVSQSGTDNDADVIQGGQGGVAPVTGNSVTITQDGAENEAQSRQVGTDGIGVISQTGDRNLASRSDGIYDSGTSNEAYLTQVGDDNEAEARFNPTPSRTNSSVVRIDQGVSGDEAFNSFARARLQGGDMNDVDIDQFGSDNQAKVDIVGGSNDVFVLQNGTGDAFNIVDIDQGGDDNVAQAIQGRQGGDNPSFGNSITIDQDGDFNFARSEQVGTNGTGVITQVGDRNEASRGIDEVPGLYDSGDGNEAYLTQVGDDNAIEVRFNPQAGGSNSNVVNVDQGIVGGTLSFDSEASIRVVGDLNNVDVDQLGSDHEVRVRINGGDSGTVTIMQTGMGNDAEAIQAGSGNTATITQN
jgi:hypothetical protein